MKKDVCLPAPVAADGGAEELFRWMGRREAFSVIAGRCSAADVECMRRIRDEKLYLSHAPDWEEFCEKYLHMSRSKANQSIALLERYGQEIFQVMQITRTSVAEYRSIAHAISAQGVEWNGEVIAIVPENSARLTAAISALRESTRTPAAEPASGVKALDAAAEKLLQRFREQAKQLGYDDPYLTSSLSDLKRKVDRLQLEIGGFAPAKI